MNIKKAGTEFPYHELPNGEGSRSLEEHPHVRLVWFFDQRQGMECYELKTLLKLQRLLH